MAQPLIQSSFNSGEWAPNLWARTDIDKYKSGAALLRNFFVDYRGGASTRTGTKYCLRGYKDSTAIRMIPFQATFTIGYACEFGANYIRFFQNGAPVLESGLSITGITNANPCVVSVSNSYSTGSVDWIYISGVAGMSQINGKYFIVQTATSGAVTLYDLFGNPVDSTSWGTYTSGGTTQRVYTIQSPYAAADLALIKFAQNVSELILCHPNYTPYVLTYNTPTNWTLDPIVIGTTISAPTNVHAASTLGAGNTFYSYVVTAVDAAGQESVVSSAVHLSSLANLALVAGTNTIAWNGVSGAQSYNVYKANSTQYNPVPTGVPYGYIGNSTSTNFADTNIVPDFTEGPPVPQNPFASGAGVQSTTITDPGSYTTAPTVTFGAAPAGGTTATGFPIFNAVSETVDSGGSGYAVNDTIVLSNGIILLVTAVSTGAVSTVSVVYPGTTAAPLPSNPLSQVSTSGSGSGATFNINWGVYDVIMTENGAGYLTTPSVTFSAGDAAGTAVLGPIGGGNPSVPAFFQDRLVLAAPLSAPQTLVMSQPGNYFNFNISNPSQADDAITASIVSGQLNTIKAMVNQPAGLIVLTDGSSWLVNGGSFGAAVTPAATVANAQSFNGANDLPPIVVVFDMIYNQSKGSVVRDSLYNFYANVYTGTDISILSSHLFYGYTLKEWAWAEEPFKIVWAVRNDGVLLGLTFLKEQEFIAWHHHDTQGSFNSVCTIIETVDTPSGYEVSVNAVYTVVRRTINGVSVQYIERFAERYLNNEAKNAWAVDCGIQYNGSPVTSFSGGEFLVGATCVGLADGVPITPFVMPASGDFTLPSPASIVTIGLAFTPQLQTLYIDAGQPTVQSKQKKINAVTARVVDTLGLTVGSTFDTLTPMQDLVVGNVGSMSNELVVDLVTGDARTYIDPMWTEQGQFCFEQPQPLPATILGVMPQLAVGDTASARAR